MTAPLLVEIGCEEIPARMIPGAAADLGARIVAILDQAGLGHGAATAWGGTRRLAVRVDAVAADQVARQEIVLGPPASAAFRPDGAPSPAGAGFAKKQGIDPAALERIETEKGVYAGFRRAAGGRSVGAVLAAALPPAVAAMSFPKTMRWADGAHRWVRPVHRVVALHGERVLPLEIFGVASGRSSEGHRFLAGGAVEIPHADRYERTLEAAFVVADPARRRALLRERLASAAAAVGGALVPDEALLEELVDLVEWPGVVAGRFDPAFLDLPAEILVTTLRHHQKAFSIRGPQGELLPAFLAVANTDRDPCGHIRRGSEWVVSGRLADARFFWNEDRKRTLASRVEDLARVTFHVKVGSYLQKAQSVARLAERTASLAGLSADDRRRASEAAYLAKADLVTGLVGEFPELQGIVGALLLGSEGSEADVARAVYEHYRPSGADDELPGTAAGAVVAVADKLDTVGALLGSGERPSGSRDPYGLRRSMNGVFRIVLDRGWRLSLGDLGALIDRNAGAATSAEVSDFVLERWQGFLRDRGFAPNEIAAVLRTSSTPAAADRPLIEIVHRLEVVKTLRDRSDFRTLVELTKRVDNILQKQPEVVDAAAARGWQRGRFEETVPAAVALEKEHARLGEEIRSASAHNRFDEVVELVAQYVAPVERFFEDVLVLDRDNPDATRARCELLARVRSTVTMDFDIRELAGQADRRS